MEYRGVSYLYVVTGAQGGWQSYPQRASVNAGFHFNQAVATPYST